jgi:hypothetical protein
LTDYPGTAAGVLQYLNDLAARQKELSQRVEYSQARNDSLDRTMGDFATLVDRMTRAQDRATVREYRDFQRDNADREADERERSKRDHEACRRHQIAYADGGYSAFGVQTPPPVSGEAPGDYRRRLFRGLQDRLSRGSKLYDIDARRLESDAIRAFEPQLFAESVREGAVPSWDNLPPFMGQSAARRDDGPARPGRANDG